MCGIVGYIGPKDPVGVLVDGLKRLEYRGYDSAGIAVVNGEGTVAIRRAAGKLRDLESVIARSPLAGRYGIGHTRWATHGRPTEENAHPHRDCTGRLVVIHNGIIENYLDLKHELQTRGHIFVTETDTEVVAHLLEQEIETTKAPLADAFRAVLPRLRGIYALVAISGDEPETLVAGRLGPPLVVGLADGELFVASDVPAILPHTKDVIFLDDHEVAILSRSGVRFVRLDGKAVEKSPSRIPWDPIMAEKGGYRHFMLKEIHEQPRAVRDTLLGRISLESVEVFLEEMNLTEEEIRSFRRATIVACGTSWHAGLVGKFLLEQLARIPTEVDYASEFRYRRPLVDAGTLPIFISQSGETADTLAAQREAKRHQPKTLAICNVRGSMLTREAQSSTSSDLLLIFRRPGPSTPTRAPRSAWPPPRPSRARSQPSHCSASSWARSGTCCPTPRCSSSCARSITSPPRWSAVSATIR